MQELNFKLTIDDANTILKALGQMPFAQVYTLIEKINQQANSQLNHGQNGQVGLDSAKEDS